MATFRYSIPFAEVELLQVKKSALLKMQHPTGFQSKSGFYL